MLSVILVEDDPRFREAFAELIRGAPDMQLLGAGATAAEGLQLLRQHEPDVVLVDLDLPDQPGIEVIRYVARHLPACDVMVVTVFADERHLLESIEAGATGYLHKDALPADFTDQIRQLHAGGSPISPLLARHLLTRLLPADPGTDDGPTPRLSEREHAVLSLVSKGYSFPEIAGLLGISPHTVMTFIKRVYRKLHVSSKTEAVYEARRMGLVRD